MPSIRESLEGEKKVPPPTSLFRFMTQTKTSGLSELQTTAFLRPLAPLE